MLQHCFFRISGDGFIAVKELLSENRGEIVSRFLFEKDCVESLLGIQGSSSPDKRHKLCKNSSCSPHTNIKLDFGYN